MSPSRLAAITAVLVLPALALAEPPPGWKMQHPDKGKWVVGTAEVDPKSPNKLVVKEGGSDVINVQPASNLVSDEKYGDCTVEVEFLIPKGSNSGVYLMGRYEVQVFDSFGKKKPTKADLGGIYNTSDPIAGNYEPKAPGEWQTLDIVFRAPRFDATGKKTADAHFTSVKLNGKEIQKDVDAPKPTGSELSPKEVPTGPIMLQGDHGPVAFRNLRIKETGK